VDVFGRFIDPIWLESVQMRIEHWLLTSVLVWPTVIQLGAVAACAALAFLIARWVRPATDRLIERLVSLERGLRTAGESLRALRYPLIFLVLVLSLRITAAQFDQPSAVLIIAVNLVGAWIVISFSTSLIGSREWARGIAITVWILAALNIVGLLGPTLDLMSRLAVPIGSRRISVLNIVTATILLSLLLLGGRLLGRFVSARLDRSRVLTPSVKVLTEKSLRIILLAAAFLITLDYLGVDLTAFAVFTGAVGVGVGFGLQKVISNLISGFILLLDRSIKPGDVIELEETFGWVRSLNARYVVLSTRDGKEWLIPNEDLITQRVINWSYSDKLLRLPLKFGVSYHSDVRKAMELAVQAAASVERVRDTPAPVCRLTGFGDSSVDMELRVWISDPREGVVNVRSEILLAMWDLFHANEIEIPFPQRDLHIKPGSELSVSLTERS